MSNNIVNKEIIDCISETAPVSVVTISSSFNVPALYLLEDLNELKNKGILKFDINNLIIENFEYDDDKYNKYLEENTNNDSIVYPEKINILLCSNNDDSVLIELKEIENNRITVSNEIVITLDSKGFSGPFNLKQLVENKSANLPEKFKEENVKIKFSSAKKFLAGG
jgi:hypothetical protein